MYRYLYCFRSYIGIEHTFIVILLMVACIIVFHARQVCKTIQCTLLFLKYYVPLLVLCVFSCHTLHYFCFVPLPAICANRIRWWSQNVHSARKQEIETLQHQSVLCHKYDSIMTKRCISITHAMLKFYEAHVIYVCKIGWIFKILPQITQW